MEIALHDIIGFSGVGLIVVTYFLSQIGRMTVNRPLYPALNAAGAFLILFSLMHTFNAASFVIESFWLAISLIGLARALIMKSK
jgi:hypothetical protein